MPLKIVRSKRKSICVSVSADNQITVRCPVSLSDKAVNKFLESKKNWLNKIISANNKKACENCSIIRYEEIFVSGKKLPLFISDKNEITENAVFVKSVKEVRKLFVTKLSAEFMEFANGIATATGLSAESFTFRRYKSRWGCCDSKRNITFNFILLMLPVNLQRYVIIHELCHTVYMNHSKEFWRLVAKYEPDYLSKRKQLKNFDFLISLY